LLYRPERIVQHLGQGKGSTMDVLSDILMRVNLKGSLYFRRSFSSPWGVEVPAYANAARFHYAHRGGCLVRVAGMTGIARLEEGDLLVEPGGKSHRLFSDQAVIPHS